MADTKTTALTENTTPVGTDIMYIVDNPGGTPASQKIQVANIGKGIKLDDLATPDNNTDLDATTGQHGLLPKLGTGTLNYLRTDGTWTSPFVYVRKTADESVSSSTSFQNDDHLVFAVGANEVWMADFTLAAQGATGGDIKLAWTYPTSCVITVWSFGPGSNLGADAADGDGRWQVLTPASGTIGALFGLAVGTPGINPVSILARVLVQNGANAGNIQLQWAQNGSSATATVVYTNSFLVAYRLA